MAILMIFCTLGVMTDTPVHPAGECTWFVDRLRSLCGSARPEFSLPFVDRLTYLACLVQRQPVLIKPRASALVESEQAVIGRRFGDGLEHRSGFFLPMVSGGSENRERTHRALWRRWQRQDTRRPQDCPRAWQADRLPGQNPRWCPDQPAGLWTRKEQCQIQFEFIIMYTDQVDVAVTSPGMVLDQNTE